ncbi:MAG: hypothetical protein IPG16_04630 [Comamonadaceae bacterium]|nr:hypothetical protein [Comamonadaceae bacterium]
MGLIPYHPPAYVPAYSTAATVRGRGWRRGGWPRARPLRRREHTAAASNNAYAAGVAGSASTGAAYLSGYAAGSVWPARHPWRDRHHGDHHDDQLMRWASATRRCPLERWQ